MVIKAERIRRFEGVFDVPRRQEACELQSTVGVEEVEVEVEVCQGG
jgi:hypothetical protein